MRKGDGSAYRVFTLPSPYRVVIDLNELEWAIPAAATPKQGGVISMLRHGLFAPGTTRVVLPELGLGRHLVGPQPISGHEDGTPDHLDSRDGRL